MPKTPWPPEMLGDLADDEQLPSVIAELEKIAEEAPAQTSVGALHVLKNEMDRVKAGSGRRRIEHEVVFLLPGGWGYRLGRWRRRARKVGWGKVFGQATKDLTTWLRGEDAERFRDRCDRYFWEVVVPEIEAHFGSIAGPLANTVNEAIINYAEYSFSPRALRRRIKAHLFKTEGELGYAIVRPLGSRLKTFDPLELKTKKMTDLKTGKRGWGFTIMLSRALFISFDQAPERRGMMIIVGPDEDDGG